MQTKDGVIEQYFTLSPRAELSVRGHTGEITVRGWSGPSARIRASSDEDLEESDIQLAQMGNRLTVTSRYGPAGMIPIEYEIDVPTDCRVTVSTVDGDVHVERTGAGGQIETPAGDVELTDVVGEYAVKTASGDLNVENLSGYIAFQTASGDAEIERSHLTGFNFESANGDVSVETTLSPQGDHRFRTVSGDLRLLLPATTRATIKLHTQSGEVECDLPASVTRSSRRHWEATLNGGGAMVEMHSLSGDLSIEETSSLTDLTPSVDEGPAPETPTGSAEILEALSRGEIDVDAAMAQLDELSR